MGPQLFSLWEELGQSGRRVQTAGSNISGRKSEGPTTKLQFLSIEVKFRSDLEVEKFRSKVE